MINHNNRFIETLCILNGTPQHLSWHQQRVDLTFHLKLSYALPFSIADICKQTAGIPTSGSIRLTIEYSSDVLDVRFAEYEQKQIRNLKLIEIPDNYDYSFKFADRTLIERLYAWRNEADDILMTRGGWITDTSIANIAFRKDGKWFTPSLPLLAGTTWKRLIFTGQLVPRPIHVKEISHFDCYKVFNAMNDIRSAAELLTPTITSHEQEA